MSKSIVLYSLCCILLFACSPNEPKIYLPGDKSTFLVEKFERDSLTGKDTLLLEIGEPSSFPQNMFNQTAIYWHYLSFDEEITEQTGVTEKENKIFLHPPRKAYLIYTELAPFPKLYFPLKKGDWAAGVTVIGLNYEDWKGESISKSDTIIGKVKNDIALVTDSVWLSRGSSAETPVGPVYTEFYFDEKVGFTRLNYSFPDMDMRIEISLLARE